MKTKKKGVYDVWSQIRQQEYQERDVLIVVTDYTDLVIYVEGIGNCCAWRELQIVVPKYQYFWIYFASGNMCKALGPCDLQAL